MIKTTLINMNRRSFFATLSTLVLSAMSVAAPVASASGKDDPAPSNSSSSSSSSSSSRSRIALGGSAANGHAEFRSESARNRSRLNVEVEDANSIGAGTVLDVFVDHAGTRTKVGSITLDAFHSGELELNSQDGDTVPAVQKGDIVIVMNAAVAIVTGAF